jgi:hypothetical protein
MSLFKSSDERRMEREMEIRKGLARIKKQIRQQEKEEKEFIKKAKRAKQLGDGTQLKVIKSNLKRTAFTRRMMERQLLNLEVFKQLKDQAEAQADFARALETVSEAVAESYGSVNLAQVHKNCERAIQQSESMQQTMELLVDQTNDSVSNMEGSQSDELVTDEEIDKLIDEAVVAEESEEIEEKVSSRLDELRDRFEKNRQKQS